MIRNLGQFPVNGPKRVVDGRHERQALDVDYGDRFARSRFDYDATVTGIGRRIVGRTKNTRLCIQVGQDFLFVPDVVSRSQDIHAQAEEFVGNLGRHAKASGCIFAVRNREVDCVLFLD